MELDRQLPSAMKWVESVVGGRIVHTETQARWRPHVFLKVETADGTLDLLLRGYRDPGLNTLEDSQDRLAFEAGLTKALNQTSVRVARFYGYNPDLHWLLLGRAPGTAMLTEVEDADRRQRIFRQYIDNLVALHSLDLDALDLPAELKNATVPQGDRLAAVIGTGASPFSTRTIESYRAWRKTEPEPLLELALTWVETNVPEPPARFALCLGDVGANQFMFHGDEMTAIVDVEDALMSDPVSDIASCIFRETAYPIGGMEDHLRYYEERSGAPVDRQRLRFHMMVAALFSRLKTIEAVHTPAPLPDHLAIAGYNLRGRRAISECLLGAEGLEPERPVLPTRPEADDATKYHELLARFLEGPQLEAARSGGNQENAYVASATAALARSLVRENEYGRQIDADSLEEVRRLLGSRPGSVRAGLAELEQKILADPGFRRDDTLQFLYRYQVRQEWLYAPLQAAGGFATGIPLPRINDVPLRAR